MDIKHSMMALSRVFSSRLAKPQPIDSRTVDDLVTNPDPPPPEPPAQQRPEPRRFGRNLVRALARQGRSTNTPHQNTRECSRRLGGNEWEAYKAADRVRRGMEG